MEKKGRGEISALVLDTEDLHDKKMIKKVIEKGENQCTGAWYRRGGMIQMRRHDTDAEA